MRSCREIAASQTRGPGGQGVRFEEGVLQENRCIAFMELKPSSSCMCAKEVKYGSTCGFGHLVASKSWPSASLVIVL